MKNKLDKYTEEQQAIILSDSHLMEVNSPPGSGKTHTILGVVEHHENDHHLIMCFNAPIKDSIREKISNKGITNAESYTFHGIAYDFFMNSDIIKGFSKRHFEDLDYFSMEEIVKNLDLDKKQIRNYINNLYGFFQSDETSAKYFEFYEDKAIYKKILNHIMNDERSKMFHSFYIKVFQLMRYQNTKYDTILVDESQDRSKCYDSIVKNMGAKRIIFLGDDAQKIYGFNGAMGMNKTEHRLSKSFRIGKDASDICNTLIEHFIKDESMYFEGLNKNSNLVDKFEQLDKITIIYRTNKAMLKRLVHECSNGKICTVVGGKNSLGINVVEKIFSASEVKPFWYRGKKITSIRDAEKLYGITKAQDIKRALEFIEVFGEDTLNKINIINGYTIDEIAYADVTFTTAHKSKGLEFENVELGEDFVKMLKLYERVEMGGNYLDEVYILYVAVSRCYGKMKLNQDIDKWFKSVRKNFKKIDIKWEKVEF